MRKSIVIVIAIALMLSRISYAEDMLKTKSFRALKMEGMMDEDQLESLEIQIEVGKIYFNEGMEKNPPPQPGSEDKKRGYILFMRHYVYNVYPFTNPSSEEINKSKEEIKIFASLGEYEPIVFSVYPFTDLKNCEITVSDFVNKKGDKLEEKDFQINNVISRMVSNDAGLCLVRADYLVRTSSIPRIDKSICKRIWVNVKVPEDAKPGDYKGKVTFKPEGKSPQSISVTVKVLPIKLMRPKPEEMFWTTFGCYGKDFEQLKKSFIMLKEHGLTGPKNGFLRPKGKNLDDFTYANKCMRLAKEIGLEGFVIDVKIQGHITFGGTYGMGAHGAACFSQPTYDRMKKIIRNTVRNAKENDWLPVYFYLTTELGNASASGKEAYEKCMRGEEEYVAAAREIKEAKLISTFNRRDQLERHWNLPTDAFGYHGEMFPAWAEAAKKKQSFVCYFGDIDKGYNADFRNVHGFWALARGLRGTRPWGRNVTMYYTNKKEVVPTVRGEKMREGIDDYTYVYTLKNLIETAKEGGKDTTSSEMVIKRILDKIPYHQGKRAKEFITAKELEEAIEFDHRILDEYRWQIVREILKCQRQ